MAKDEKPGHRTSADFAGSDHLDRHPREVHGQPWEAGNWHIGRRHKKCGLAGSSRTVLLSCSWPCLCGMFRDLGLF